MEETEKLLDEMIRQCIISDARSLLHERQGTAMKFLVTYYEKNEQTDVWELHKEICEGLDCACQCLFPVGVDYKLVSIETCNL